MPPPHRSLWPRPGALPYPKAKPQAKRSTSKPVKKARPSAGWKKRPTIYNKFVKEHYHEVKEAHPELTGREIKHLVIEMWKVHPSNPKASKPKEPGQATSD
ncbi:MAG: hypothetical protein M1817_004414 [Caeruleum heppii]|nr:MAG: hypothetical protein M1817_004414 [Caeruleum heppii]